MSAVLSEIVTLMLSALSSFATGIGSGLSALTKSIFLTESTSGTYSLSTFGGVIIIFAGISLTIGLSRLIVNWVTSLGK